MTDYVYLDNAATTFPKPPEVIREMCDFYLTRGVNPGRTGFDLALEAEQTVLQAREKPCLPLHRTSRGRETYPGVTPGTGAELPTAAFTWSTLPHLPKLHPL